MKIAILGFGIEGQSAYRYYRDQGTDITICDMNEALELPEGVHGKLGEGYLQDLSEFDVILRTASINPTTILAANAGIESKITTVVNEFLRVCPTKNIIGVTGTKGKGTTSTLITKILEASGHQVLLAGNIGISPLDSLHLVTPESWVVLELSSFQLADLQHSPHISVCLMIAPEHLNWHIDMEDYIRAKAQLFAHQNAHDIAIYFADNEYSHDIASASPGAKITYYAPPGAFVRGREEIIIDEKVVCRVDELKMLGEHNWQNACAAITAAWQVTKDVAAMHQVLTTFTGLEHRLEFVRTVDDVAYYDDSFGTMPEAAEVAIQAFTQPKVVILGGSDKGASFDGLAAQIKQAQVRHVVLIGVTAAIIQAALEKVGFTDFSEGGTTMRSIVAEARKYAQPGDVVLLAPACASFGLFRDYKDRGEQFKAAVQALPADD
ncbi:MAG TPA: UDP-N-acetylmuramoyl-L-alanine--D-glutamate ligase [Candidatus Saccharimonadales bacterium]|jgi:UDP-N-acetylmuramoylalanine--D-glutamate ligase|nr:UDP-N-acetylmuramoyl-L-alanine--D-glutamate ligase [Candidatus Saccharimonadales bacterium]